MADVDEDDSQIVRNAAKVQKLRIQQKVLSVVPEDAEDKLNSMGDFIGSFPD